MLKKIVVAAAILLFALAAGCSKLHVVSQPATADLVDEYGKLAGVVTMVQSEGELLMRLHIRGLDPGGYVMRVHQNGECTPPGFQSAGPVVRAAATRTDAAIRFQADAAGEAEFRDRMPGFSLTNEGRSVLGKALVVSEQRGRGVNVACGVVEYFEPRYVWYPAI